MKRNLVYLLIVFIFLSIPSVMSDGWDDISDLDRAWDGQKSITNKEFEEAMDVIQGKSKKREARRQKRKARKISGGGTSLHPDLNPDKDIPELKSIKTDPNEGILVNLPVQLVIEGTPLDKGYYNVVATRDNDKKIYVNFYQSQFLKGRVEATETDEDFGQKEVDFATVLEYTGSFVKMVFGCIDFNAYVYIPYIE